MPDIILKQPTVSDFIESLYKFDGNLHVKEFDCQRSTWLSVFSLEERDGELILDSNYVQEN